MVARPQMPHTHGVGRADPERHHHHGEHGRSWPLDRKTPRLFPRDIRTRRTKGTLKTLLAAPSSTPSRKRKRCQSPPPNQLSRPTNSAGGRQPLTVAERKPLADAQNLAIIVQTPLVRKAPNTSFESRNNHSSMAYPPYYTTQLPPSSVAALSPPAAAAYTTATSFRQCVQRYADKNHYAVYTNYHGTGAGHAQAWRAQITLTQKSRSGHDVAVIDHTSVHWYTKQADAKEAASAEVWSMLDARRY